VSLPILVQMGMCIMTPFTPHTMHTSHNSPVLVLMGMGIVHHDTFLTSHDSPRTHFTPHTIHPSHNSHLRCGWCELCEALLASGADVHARAGSEGATAIHMACGKGSMACCVALLQVCVCMCVLCVQECMYVRMQ